MIDPSCSQVTLKRGNPTPAAALVYVFAGVVLAMSQQRQSASFGVNSSLVEFFCLCFLTFHLSFSSSAGLKWLGFSKRIVI